MDPTHFKAHRGKWDEMGSFSFVHDLIDSCKATEGD